jgi:hypothetical protein
MTRDVKAIKTRRDASAAQRVRRFLLAAGLSPAEAFAVRQQARLAERRSAERQHQPKSYQWNPYPSANVGTDPDSPVPEFLGGLVS